jgi:hypothetical protein
LLRSFPLLQVPVTDAGVVQDIDYPADLHAAGSQNDNSKFPEINRVWRNTEMQCSFFA